MATSTSTQVARHSTSRASIGSTLRHTDASTEPGAQLAGKTDHDSTAFELQTLPPAASPLSRRSTTRSLASSTDTPVLEPIRTAQSRNRSGAQPERVLSRVSQLSSGRSSIDREPKNALSRFWGDHVSMRVAHDTSRDHLALERTYLGYFRTSTLLATAGVVITQLYVLQGTTDDIADTTSFRVGRSLATACFALALGTIFTGTCRFLRIQQALVRGKALSGGFEVSFVLSGVGLLLVAMFVIVILGKM